MPLTQLQLKPSKTYFLIMLFILGGALVSIFCSFLTYHIQLFLGLAALVYGGRLLWGEVLLRDPRAIVALTCRADQSWLLKERSGEEYPAALCGDSLRWGWVSVLRFQRLTPGGTLEVLKKKKRCSVVFYDAVGSVNYRRLLMSLGTIKIH